MMSHQQLADTIIIVSGVGALAVLGVLELAYKGWLQRRRDRRFLERVRRVARGT